MVLLCIYMSKVHAFGEESEDVCNFFTVQVAEDRDSAQRGRGVSLPGISKRCLDTVLSSGLWEPCLSREADLGDPQWSFQPDPLCGEAAFLHRSMPSFQAILKKTHPAPTEQVSHSAGVVTPDFHTLNIPSTSY